MKIKTPTCVYRCSRCRAEYRTKGKGKCPACKLPLQATVPMMLAALFTSHGIPLPVPEFHFHGERKWAFDWAWMADGVRLAVEIEGGAWSGGRHTSGKGFTEDMVKYREAFFLGWIVLRFTPQEVQGGEAFAVIRLALEFLGYKSLGDDGGRETKVRDAG